MLHSLPKYDDVILVNHVTLGHGDCFRELKDGKKGDTIYEVTSVISGKTPNFQSMVGARPLFYNNSMATKWFMSGTIYYPLPVEDRNLIALHRERERKNKEQQKAYGADAEYDITAEQNVEKSNTNECRALIHAPRTPIVETPHPNSQFFEREFW